MAGIIHAINPGHKHCCSEGGLLKRLDQAVLSMHEDNTRINTGAQSMLINVHAVQKIFHTVLCFYSYLPLYGVDLLE